MRSGRCSFPLVLLIWLITGGAALADDAQIYASLYPFYAELCAVSGFKKKSDIIVLNGGGGPGGHAVFYLNGACRVKDAHYPTIELCGPNSGDGQNGVGLSVNAHFRNANWVATEGRDFFFRGDLAPGERLTPVAFQRTLARAKKIGIYDGVEFHDEVFNDMPPGMARRDYMYEVSIPTDYAVSFGRKRFCARVPVNREQMAAIVRFLNDLNESYREGTKEFEWSVLQNNCAHTIHNALAAAGVWKEWKTDQFILLAALDFPVPANEFVNLMRRTNDLPLEDLDELYADKSARQDLVHDGQLPTQPGALAEWEPPISQNDLYETDVRLIFYDEPIFALYEKWGTTIATEPRYSDIRANLEYFANLYERIGKSRKPVASYVDAGDRMYLNTPENVPPPQRKDFPAFYAQFYRYIEKENDKVAALLRSLPPDQRGDNADLNVSAKHGRDIATEER